MANWKETLNIKDLHEAYDEETIAIEDLAKEVHNRCMKLKCANDSIFTELIEELNEIDDVEDYDYILASIYDYGDLEHRLWVKTA